MTNGVVSHTLYYYYCIAYTWYEFDVFVAAAL